MTGGANAGQFLLSGGRSAAETLRPSAAISPFGEVLSQASMNRQLTSGISSWLSGLGRQSNPMGLGSINPVTGEYMGSLEF